MEQGSYGTHFLAALVSKAPMDPASIAKMIKDNGNGNGNGTWATLSLLELDKTFPIISYEE